MRPEEVDPERTLLLPLLFWYETEECLDEIPELLVLKQLDTLVDALALDAGAIPDGDGLVFLESQIAVFPLVPDDVSRPLPVTWPIALIAPELPAVEVLLLKVLRAFRREADVPFGGQGIALILYLPMDSAQLRGWTWIRSIGHITHSLG